jgi:hypothetical protein
MVAIWILSAKRTQGANWNTNDEAIFFLKQGSELILLNKLCLTNLPRLVGAQCLAGRRLRRWLNTLIMLCRSPSVPMGNVLFPEVETTVKVWTEGRSAVLISTGCRGQALLAGPTRIMFVQSPSVPTGNIMFLEVGPGQLGE